MAVGLLSSFIVGVALLPTVEAQLQCAPAGQALCGYSLDQPVIQHEDFAMQLVEAAFQAFSMDTSGKDALAGVIGKHALSHECLACQGAAIDCALKQTDCFQFCAESPCSYDCRACIRAACSVQKACGGEPGQTLQMPYSCPAPQHPQLVIDRRLLNVAFRGRCLSSAYSYLNVSNTADEATTEFYP
eukprot:TRINITY_DN13959_c0_g1_i1.p1 TRINITY_DN13959_c0_g1~~TRINITY_DN13959_c0_g1_i1.p1  ORF type:complete len:187 (-),score=22.51 TRINITY_DN13959_c0_g1_i1:444-1004(-)